jgi:hypothetical protein
LIPSDERDVDGDTDDEHANDEPDFEGGSLIDALISAASLTYRSPAFLTSPFGANFGVSSFAASVMLVFSSLKIKMKHNQEKIVGNKSSKLNRVSRNEESLKSCCKN